MDFIAVPAYDIAMDSRHPLLPHAIIALGLIVATMIGGAAFIRGKHVDAGISVTGSAQRRIVSDQARWTVRLERSGDLSTLKDGNALLAADLTSLLAFIKKQGLSGSGVTVQPPTLTTLTNYNQGPIPIGYQLSQIVTVESSNVALVTQIAAGSTGLVSRGALLSTVSLEYVYTHLQELRVSMLAEAMSNARERAAGMARSAGVSLGALTSASTGVFQITPVNSTDVSDSGTYDTTSVEKQITAVVRANFDIR